MRVPLIASAAMLLACSAPGPELQKLPNAAKADQAALIVSLADEAPRSFYFECAAREGCDISFAVELRAPSACELVERGDDCADRATSPATPIAELVLETPAGEVFAREIVVAEGGGAEVVGGRFARQAPGTYFVDLRRAAAVDQVVELGLEASYAASGAELPVAPCELGVEPELIDAEARADRRWVALRWTGGDESWFAPEGEAFTVGDDSRLGRYRAEVAAALDSVDPLDLLRRQRALYERVAPAHVPTYDAILAGEIGSIGGLECWEAAMLEDHLRRHIEQQTPNEFQAFLLTKPSETGALRARLYGISGNMPWAPSATPLWEHLEADLEAGWEMASHLHNHLFFLSHLPSGDVAGTLIPSPPDRSSYVSHAETFELAEARITNAFDTIQFSQAEFQPLVDLLDRP